MTSGAPRTKGVVGGVSTVLEALIVGVSRWIGDSIASDDRSQKVARVMLSVVTDMPVVRSPFEEDEPLLPNVSR